MGKRLQAPKIRVGDCVVHAGYYPTGESAMFGIVLAKRAAYDPDARYIILDLLGYASTEKMRNIEFFSLVEEDCKLL